MSPANLRLPASRNSTISSRAEWALASGRAFTEAELNEGAKVAIIGASIVEQLFDNGIGTGETIRIGNVPFSVVAVLDTKGQGAGGRSQDDIIFIPLAAARSRVLGNVRGSTRTALDFIMIKAADKLAIPELKSDITTLPRQRHQLRTDAPEDFAIENPADVLTARQGAQQTLRTPLDIYRFGVSTCWWHQRYERNAGVGRRTDARDWAADGGRCPPSRYKATIPDRSCRARFSWRADRHFRGLCCGRNYCVGGTLAGVNQPLSRSLGMGVRRRCRDRLWPISGVSSLAPRSDRGFAVRVGGQQKMYANAARDCRLFP